MSKTNISQFVREISAIEGKLHKVGGERLSNELMEAFEVLVNETPQWSGTTAASWTMGFRAPDVLVEFPKLSREQAMQRGMDPAVSAALSRSQLSADLKDYARADIKLTNPSPNYDTAMEGPLRDVNKPPGAIDRFEARVAGIIIDLNDIV